MLTNSYLHTPGALVQWRVDHTTIQLARIVLIDGRLVWRDVTHILVEHFCTRRLEFVLYGLLQEHAYRTD